MPTLIRMPEVAANATHAVLVAWSVDVGERVDAGDCVAEIETDKAMVDLEAPEGGTLARRLVDEGANVEVGAPVGILVAVGEQADDLDAWLAVQRGEAISVSVEANASGPVASISANAHVSTPTKTISADTNASTLTNNVGASAAAVQPVDEPARRERVFASPLARRVAHERGLDLVSLSERGSGPGGRIVRRDVERALAANDAKAPVAPAPAPETAHTVIPHTPMRRTIARRLTESKATIPHFYVTIECRMDALLALRAQINDAIAQRISINDLLIKAAACALRDVPEMNVSWTDDALHQYGDADVAVAVSTGAGLYTPVVRRAQDLTLSAISATMRTLVERAHAGLLTPADYQGGAFSLSNLGMYGVREFSAIINPPQTAILAVGATQKTPVVIDDALAIAQTMRCTLSADHRAIDGALAARWLDAFRHGIEHPAALLV